MQPCLSTGIGIKELISVQNTALGLWPLLLLPFIMKLLLVLMSVVALSTAQTYSTENDDLDIEALISSADGLKSYYECFADKGPCDEVQGAFKKDVPEAVQQACAKCTPAQKHILDRFLAGLKEKLPETYEAFKKTFDPDNKHFDALEAAVANS